MQLADHRVVAVDPQEGARQRVQEALVGVRGVNNFAMDSVPSGYCDLAVEEQLRRQSTRTVAQPDCEVGRWLLRSHLPRQVGRYTSLLVRPRLVRRKRWPQALQLIRNI